MMEVRIFKNTKELSEVIIKELIEISHYRTKCNIALSGGNTPRKIFEELSMSTQINWDNLRIFWTDERCVPPDDVESNFHLAKIFLLDKIKIPEVNIYRIRGEDEPETEATRYSNLINRKFDLIFAGIGSDGHTASIFPESDRLLNSEKNYEISFHPLSHQERITMTGKMLLNANKIIFCVTGKDKAQIIKKISEENFNCPASYVLKHNSNSFLYMTKDAAHFLKYQKSKI